MGEAVVVSNEGVRELEVKERETEIEMETQPEKKEIEGGSADTPSVVRWERFLPRKVLRVLLVEADDSTRQIIAALLRKCSYKVATVSDGLKAWEVLKGRPHNIDLILTEVELPSISGFALLTLIAEHELCKNIPVIMMSSQDSVSTVYQCMLRGAADFLVKPVRKNELRNLWQHVWRRQASSGSVLGPLDESVAQQKVEATAENNATSNQSSGYRACIQRNRECIEKGGDSQSSCTKPDLEDEEAHMEHLEDLSQPKWNKSLSGDMNIQKHEECTKANMKFQMHDCEAGGSLAVTSKDDNTIYQKEDIDPDSQCEHVDANNISQACDNNHVLVNSSGEAIDLIGAFDNYHQCDYISSGSCNNANKIDSSSLLDLSLRRSHPSGSVNQVTDERHKLNHSDASAFSRYINSAMQSRHSTSPSICNQQKGCEANSAKKLTNHNLDYNSDTHGQTVSSSKNTTAMPTGQLGQAEMSFPCPQQKVFPVPVRGIRFENLSTAYGTLMPPIVWTQSDLSPMQSPGSAGHQEPCYQMNTFQPFNPEARNSQQLYDLMDQKGDSANEQIEDKQGHKLESLEDRAHFSSATDQSVSSSFCNGDVSHLNSIGCGSNGNINPVSANRDTSECGNEEGFVFPDGKSHRSTQREAALTKFRLKRKERCYEKKVRYESRKKLAEQRPRVKGQFVRQAHTEPQLTHADNHCGNSSGG
ncbi:unnamed protein product [Ilex paraguariensis]|uniref:Two-component response regulator-like APRR5 n=1 Tax=Ilex paraguariensis TaxID=185542 RepID=A0ABC8SSR5_9AQUA